jgi:hypothetical protein
MTLQNNNTPSPIQFFLGIAGILVSLYFSVRFVLGSATGAEAIAAIVFCLIMEWGKVSISTECLTAVNQK